MSSPSKRPRKPRAPKKEPATTAHAVEDLPRPEAIVWPETLPDAFDRLRLSLTRRGRLIDPSDTYQESVNKILRLLADTASKCRDSAYSAEAAELASWADVREMAEPTGEPAGDSLWYIARFVAIAHELQTGAPRTPAQLRQLSAEIRNYKAAITCEPLELRVEASKLLREGKAIEQRAPGPSLVARSFAGPALLRL